MGIMANSFGELQAWNPQINSICSNLLLDTAQVECTSPLLSSLFTSSSLVTASKGAL